MTYVTVCMMVFYLWILWDLFNAPPMPPPDGHSGEI